MAAHGRVVDEVIDQRNIVVHTAAGRTDRPTDGTIDQSHRVDERSPSAAARVRPRPVDDNEPLISWSDAQRHHQCMTLQRQIGSHDITK